MSGPVRALDTRLRAAGDPKKREWWTTYLKGVIPFYGVGIPDIRALVAAWHDEHGLDATPGDELIALASELVTLPVAEDKLAAIVLLQEHGLDRLEPDRHLPLLAGWFDAGHVADWNSCDWLCVRVLGPLIGRHGEPVARQIAAWTSAPVLWRRRAAGVAFVNLAPDGDANFSGFTDLVLSVCAHTAGDPQRFAQTGTGWVLRELSKADPVAVATFVSDHVHLLSREAIKMATARLAEADRRRLLAAHNGNPAVKGGHAGR